MSSNLACLYPRRCRAVVFAQPGKAADTMTYLLILTNEPVRFNIRFLWYCPWESMIFLTRPFSFHPAFFIIQASLCSAVGFLPLQIQWAPDKAAYHQSPTVKTLHTSAVYNFYIPYYCCHTLNRLMAHNEYTSPGQYDQVDKAAQLPTSTSTSTDDASPSSASSHPAHHHDDSNRLNMPPSNMPVSASQPSSQNPNPAGNPNSQTSINEAVNSAFYQANTPAYLSPEVVSQITATVIQQLKVTGLDNIQSPPPPPQQQSHPPSQYRTHPQQWSHASTSPVPPRPDPSPARSGYNGDSAQRPDAVAGDVDDQTYPIPTGYSSSRQPLSEVQSERLDDPPSPDSAESPNRESRPRCAPRTATLVEMSTLERIWGQLFEDGKPTERLGQFLRGIAVHLVR